MRVRALARSSVESAYARPAAPRVATRSGSFCSCAHDAVQLVRVPDRDDQSRPGAEDLARRRTLGTAPHRRSGGRPRSRT